MNASTDLIRRIREAGYMGDIAATTDKVNGHAHEFVLRAGLMTGAGYRGTSSEDPDGHVHIVELDNQQLAAIQTGDPVTIRTSPGPDHDHTVTFRVS